jgi:pSer/pThr/pTyr-binding forkhead associated (FHA) protein
MVEDLGSAGGTWVDGERIDSPQLVDRDATLSLGSATLQIVLRSRPQRGEELAALS